MRAARSKKKTVMRAAIYARVSTLDQEPENQLAELRRYVHARSWPPAVEYVDHGVSGTRDRRPALDRLITDAMIKVIEAQPDRQIVVGSRRYYAGFRKATKCMDVADAVQTVLELLGPEILARCLKAQPFRPAALRSEFNRHGYEGVFLRLFKTERKGEVRDGRSSKQLLAVDDRFSNSE